MQYRILPYCMEAALPSINNINEHTDVKKFKMALDGRAWTGEDWCRCDSLRVIDARKHQSSITCWEQTRRSLQRPQECLEVGNLGGGRCQRRLVSVCIMCMCFPLLPTLRRGRPLAGAGNAVAGSTQWRVVRALCPVSDDCTKQSASGYGFHYSVLLIVLHVFVIADSPASSIGFRTLTPPPAKLHTALTQHSKGGDPHATSMAATSRVRTSSVLVAG